MTAYEPDRRRQLERMSFPGTDELVVFEGRIGARVVRVSVRAGSDAHVQALRMSWLSPVQRPPRSDTGSRP